VIMLALALTLPVAALLITAQAGAGRDVSPHRPQGPCDIYVAASCPCVAAHSTTRALSASYNGPLYRVMRQSDGKTLDIVPIPGSRGTYKAPFGFTPTPSKPAMAPSPNWFSARVG
jgi:hypothetical protein